MPDDHREVLAQIRDERERVPGIEGERREHRADLAREVPAQVLAHGRRPRILVEERDLLLLEQLPQLCPRRGLIAQHPARARAHRFELLLGVEPVGGDVLDLLAQLLQRRRHANHEELVEVRAGDGEELDAFEQRMRRVARLGQHALVELQPAELPVDVQGRVLEVGGVRSRGDGLRCGDAGARPGAAGGALPCGRDSATADSRGLSMGCRRTSSVQAREYIRAALCDAKI